VSKLTTDVVTYCTEASNQKSKYAYRKILFYKKSTADSGSVEVNCKGYFTLTQVLAASTRGKSQKSSFTVVYSH